MTTTEMMKKCWIEHINSSIKQRSIKEIMSEPKLLLIVAQPLIAVAFNFLKAEF